MKRLLILLVISLFALMIPFVSPSVKAETATSYAIKAEDIDTRTREICTVLKDRTSFTDACRTAAETICTYFCEGLTAEVQTYEREISVQNGLNVETKTLKSYNVIAATKRKDESKKTILITTCFANHCSDNSMNKGLDAEGALGTAATTALTIELANYLSANSENNAYNYTFAFFSGTDEGNFGSEAYKTKYGAGGDVILVINLERLGLNSAYYYTDEVPTSHGEFISQFAKSSGLNFSEFPTAGRVLLGYQTVDDLPYTHYAIMGDIATFLSSGKSCLELIGGQVKGFEMDEDGEKKVINTSEDTYDNLVALHSDYAQRLSEAGQFVIDLTAKSELQSVCNGAAQSYKIFTRGWVAYVICLGIIVVLILIMIFVLRFLEKRYPIPKPPKVKIAVFGKEFEDFKENEIVVDIKRNEDSKDDNKDDGVDPFDKKQ